VTQALDIIQDAYELLGVYAPGDTISAADSSRAVSVLNSLIDEWAAQNLYVYSLNALAAAVTSGTAQYTVGESGASVTAIRPDKITYGNGAASLTIGSATTPVKVVSAIEYQVLAGAAPASSQPDTLWYDTSTYPNGTLNLLPKPSANGTLTFTAWQRILSFPLQTTAYTLAVGVYEALRDNLSTKLKPYFTDSQLDPLVVEGAMTAKNALFYQSVGSRAMMTRFRGASK
jgi:hypothetical protein